MAFLNIDKSVEQVETDVLTSLQITLPLYRSHIGQFSTRATNMVGKFQVFSNKSMYARIVCVNGLKIERVLNEEQVADI